MFDRELYANYANARGSREAAPLNPFFGPGDAYGAGRGVAIGCCCCCALIAVRCMPHMLQVKCRQDTTLRQHISQQALFALLCAFSVPVAVTKEFALLLWHLPIDIWSLSPSLPLCLLLSPSQWQLWQLAALEIDWELAIISGISDNLHCQLPQLLPRVDFHCLLQLTLERERERKEGRKGR